MVVTTPSMRESSGNFSRDGHPTSSIPRELTASTSQFSRSNFGTWLNSRFLLHEASRFGKETSKIFQLVLALFQKQQSASRIPHHSHKLSSILERGWNNYQNSKFPKSRCATISVGRFDGLRRCISFFIERRNRPKLELYQGTYDINPVSFDIISREGIVGGVQTKKVHTFSIVVFNDGSTDARRPELRITRPDYDPSAENSGSIWGAFFRLRKQANFTEFVPLRAVVISAMNVDNRELAYALVGQGFARVDEVPADTWEEFVLAFAFEGDTHFFIAEDKFSAIPRFPIGENLRLDLWAKYADRENVSLSESTLVLKTKSWDAFEFESEDGSS